MFQVRFACYDEAAGFALSIEIVVFIVARDCMLKF